MARKLRLQYAGAFYHVINRGNYRADVFASDGAKDAFLECLGEACAKTGWKVHGYLVMRNHYHLALETPEPNLVEGMQWLQSTYANRFNRFRGERGHVFQGRYQAIVVEDGAHLGAVAHYIHLNPVRARIVSVRQANEYRWSSLRFLRPILPSETRIRSPCRANGRTPVGSGLGKRCDAGPAQTRRAGFFPPEAPGTRGTDFRDDQVSHDDRCPRCRRTTPARCRAADVFREVSPVHLAG